MSATRETCRSWWDRARCRGGSSGACRRSSGRGGRRRRGNCRWCRGHARARGGGWGPRGGGSIELEEDDVAGLGGDGTGVEALHVGSGHGGPLAAEEAAGVLTGAELETAILGGGGVDADHGGDEEIGVGAPAGLLVLVGLEAVAAGELEVDLVLEEHGGLAEEGGHGATELGAVAEGGEAGVKGAEVLHALEDALGGVEEAGLEVHHGAAGSFGLSLDLVGPRGDLAGFRRVEETGNHHEAVAPEDVDHSRRLRICRVRIRRALA